MNSNNQVACPLDCFDTCQAVFKNGVLKGSKEHKVTKGKLCVNFANLLKEPYLKNSFLNGEKIPLDDALNVLVEKLKQTDANDTLYYRGAGNLGVMQHTTKSFFVKHDAVCTKGSLCDEIGATGLEMGREGKNVNPPIENLLSADVIISWGRNFSISSPHMYKLVKDKTFITIDPVKTDIAKKSQLHLQLNPKTDHELALLLTRFAHMQNLEDSEFIQNYSTNSEEFFELAQSKPLVAYENITGIDLRDITKFFEIIEGKKVAIMLGLGVQKYFEGAQIIRAVDSFGAFLGLHNKDNGGVWYLDDSSYGYTKPFDTNTKKEIPLPTVDFSKYKLVFIQGANPVVSAPNTKKVIEGLAKSFVVFFGTVENETSKYANLIIPSPNFLTKGDVRLSYGHNLKAISYKVEEKDSETITEYELTQFLNKEFGFEKILEEEEILHYYRDSIPDKSHKFNTFEFIDELEVESLEEKREENQFFFITTKRKQNLNSQFVSDDKIYLNPVTGIEEGTLVKVSSSYGEALFEVALNEDIKQNCVLTYAGNRKANFLTPFKCDEVANSATFQEVLVRVDLP